MKFGEKLKNARIRIDMTQEAVAKTIGVSRQSLSNWENDRTYPDLASVLKLSDLYGLSLDDLLREDMDIRRRMEQRRKREENLGGWLHDFAMLLIASAIPLTWLEKTALSVTLGFVGILLIIDVHLLFVLRLGSDWKTMALRCLAMVLWFSGYMLRVLSNHSNMLGDMLWFGGLAMYWYGAGHRNWNAGFPRRMTVFTGFVFAMVIVFGTIPFVGNFVKRGDHIVGNPFTGQNYRVTKVLAGDEAHIPLVYLGRTGSVWLDYPEAEERQLEGEFTYITQPEGAKHQGIWEMIPADNRELLYRITLEADDSVLFACQENGQEQWRYRLEPAPTMGCTILDVLGSIVGSAEWYYEGAFEENDSMGSLPLRGKGTVKLSVPGDSPTVTIHEEFRDGDTVEYQTMVLERDSRGFVEFKRETRQDGGNQTGIYRIPYQEGEFVLVLKYVK